MRVITKRKATGAHFTPRELALFVAHRIIQATDLELLEEIKVLDPSCGDGELLLAFVNALPTKYLARIVLVGIDSNDAALEEARSRLAGLPIKALKLEVADFLDICKNQQIQPNLFDDKPAHDILINRPSIIIANPPYVRTQILGANKAQELAAYFGLSGRVDLYHAFLVAMTSCLSSGGTLGVITSNRFLSTKGGSSIRSYLASEYNIAQIFDLGDTKLFEAAVLPAVFIGRRQINPEDRLQHKNQNIAFGRIYEHAGREVFHAGDFKQATSICGVLEQGVDGYYKVSNRYFKLSTGLLSIPSMPSDPWRMVTPSEHAWLEKINSNSKLNICDIVKVRVGIKTTADEVFIRKDWDNLFSHMRPESELLHPLLSHDDSGRWVSQTEIQSLRRVLYPHERKNGRRTAVDLKQYPKTSEYLESYRSRLERRTYILKANRSWYEIWVPHNPESWQKPKIVFPDISPKPEFFYDGDGCVVDGNCYWIALDDNRDPDMLFLIQGIANSNLMTRYHDLAFNNKLYSGRRRYLTQYVEKYPLPEPSNRYAKEIIELTKELVFTKPTGEYQQRKEQDLEIAIASAFGVEPIFNL